MRGGKSEWQVEWGGQLDRWDGVKEIESEWQVMR